MVGAAGGGDVSIKRVAYPAVFQTLGFLVGRGRSPGGLRWYQNAPSELGGLRELRGLKAQSDTSIVRSEAKGYVTTKPNNEG